MENWTASEWAAFLGGVGDFLVGLGAVAAVVLGAIGASRELKKRREERDDARDEVRRAKRAEVAADLAVATQRFLVSMQMVTAPFVRGADAKPSLRDDAAEHLRRRWDEAAPTTRAFLDAWTIAKIFLPDDVERLCLDIWRYRAEVMTGHDTWLEQLGRLVLDEEGRRAARGDDKQQKEEREAVQRSIGMLAMQRAAELSERALAVLRPYAQLHPGADEQAANRAPLPTRYRVAVPPDEPEEEAEGGGEGEGARKATLRTD